MKDVSDLVTLTPAERWSHYTCPWCYREVRWGVGHVDPASKDYCPELRGLDEQKVWEDRVLRLVLVGVGVLLAGLYVLYWR